MKLSIVVPAFNEADRIGPLLTEIDESLAPLGDDYEVIVVDDGSTDGTAAKARTTHGRTIAHSVNQGKAAAVQTGLAASAGDYVAVLDADLEYRAADLLPMLEKADSVERSRGTRPAVYGSRYLLSANFRNGVLGRLRLLRGQELTSWVANWTLTGLAFFLFGKWITDTLTGLKLYPGTFLRGQHLLSTGFEGDHEITARLVRGKIPIVEVPIAYTPRSRAEGKKIGPKDGVKAVATLVRFRFR